MQESIGTDRKGNYIFVEKPECQIDVTDAQEQQASHIYHHYDNPLPKISVEVEHNSRGTNYKAGVSGCRSVDEAISLLRETVKRIQAEYSNAPADKNLAGKE